jgi:transposase
MKKRYVGVDLHRNVMTVCYRDEEGRNEIKSWPIGGLKAFSKGLTATDKVAVEATGNTRLFTEAIKGSGCGVTVVNPHQFEVISRSVKKTDEEDAKVLAEFLAKDMLPEVRMKEGLQARIASLVQTRDKLVKLRTILKNKINNLLAGRGILLRKESLASERGLEEVLKMDVDELEKVELEILVNEIRHLNEGIKKVEEVLKEQGPKLPGWKNITSIKGIGAVGANIMLSAIGNVHDFTEEGKLASYFGIVPRVRNSNETEHSGRITKKGNKLARTALVQCSLIAIKYSPYLNSYYRKIEARRGTGKAIIAVARKMLGIIYRTLKNDWVFKDFPNYILETSKAV